MGGEGGGSKYDFCQLNDQLVGKIIQYKQSDNDEMVREGESVVVVWGERVGGVNMTSAS